MDSAASHSAAPMLCTTSAAACGGVTAWDQMSWR